MAKKKQESQEAAESQSAGVQLHYSRFRITAEQSLESLKADPASTSAEVVIVFAAMAVEAFLNDIAALADYVAPLFLQGLCLADIEVDCRLLA